jgi:hypothetical protein
MPIVILLQLSQVWVLLVLKSTFTTSLEDKERFYSILLSRTPHEIYFNTIWFISYSVLLNKLRYRIIYKYEEWKKRKGFYSSVPNTTVDFIITIVYSLFQHNRKRRRPMWITYWGTQSLYEEDGIQYLIILDAANCIYSLTTILWMRN